MNLSHPRVMGILNVTPDSFYDGGSYTNETAVAERVAAMLSQGADMVDVGAISTRPGSAEITVEEERSRLHMALGTIHTKFKDVCISVDTYRAEIAEFVVREFGAGMINDISAGRWDDRMLPVLGELKVPYVIMHTQGNPLTMQKNPQYADVTRELMVFFAERIEAARLYGISDIIIDPGFGFGKTPTHNFRILKELGLLTRLGVPVMAGLSRKSMVYRSLNTDPQGALNGTTVLNTLALANGASILRVHDVKEASEAVKLFRIYRDTGDLSDIL